MTQTQQEIEKLRTLQESYDVLTDAVENQLPALADKIDNILEEVGNASAALTAINDILGTL